MRLAALLAVAVVGAGAVAGAARAAFSPPVQLAEERGAGLRYVVRALRRDAGHAFGAIRTVASSRAFTRNVAVAGDEDGRVTLAWSEQRFDHGAMGAVLTATARAGRPFAAPRTIVARRGRVFSAPALAASGGHVALGWSFTEGRHRVGVQASVGPARASGPAQTVADVTLKSNLFLRLPAVTALLAPRGPATLVFGQPVEPTGPGGLRFRLLSTDGS